MAPADVGDDVRPEHFKAFYFDGDQGFQIAPGTWHNPPYFKPPPVDSSEQSHMKYRNKQSSVFACVWLDTLKEFGVLLKFPLTLDTWPTKLAYYQPRCNLCATLQYVVVYIDFSYQS